MENMMKMKNKMNKRKSNKDIEMINEKYQRKMEKANNKKAKRELTGKNGNNNHHNGKNHTNGHHNSNYSSSLNEINKNKIKIAQFSNIMSFSNQSLITCENCGLTMSHYAKMAHEEKECEALFENYIFDGKVVAPEVQRDEIKKIIEETKLFKGRMHYVISGKWWSLWKSYVQYDEENKIAGSHPGAINNDDLVETTKKKRVPKKKEENKTEDSNKNDKIDQNKDEKIDTNKQDIIENNNENKEEQEFEWIEEQIDISQIAVENLKIKYGVKKDYDYVTVPSSAWQRLHAWYGGGPQFPRRVITVGLLGQGRVDLYPIRLQCNIEEDNKEFGYIFFHYYFSRSDRIKEVRFQLATFKNYPPHKCDVVIVDNEGNRVKKFGKDEIETTLMELDLEEDTRIIVESPNMETEGSYYGGGGYSGYSNWKPTRLKNEVGQSLARGACGFNNLGNTCFMNSAVQCISNVPALVAYFINGEWKEEVNKENRLGTKGAMPTSYEDLLKQMYCNKFTCVVPKELKTTIGKFAPQFQGYEQQDAQELLSYLISGLHEDLKKTPPKVEVNEENQNVKNNGDYEFEQSKIMDIFGGKLKSTVKCLTCDGNFEKKEPLMYLSLPIPGKVNRLIEVNFFPVNGKPYKYGVRAPKSGTLFNLRMELSKLCGVKDSNIAFAEVYGHNSFMLSPEKMLMEIRSSDVISSYEVNELTHDEKDEKDVKENERRCFVFQRHKTGKEYYSTFGAPFMLAFKEKKTPRSEIHQLVKDRLNSFFPEFQNKQYEIRKIKWTESKIGEEFPDDQEVFELNTSEAIALVWEEECYKYLKENHNKLEEHESCKKTQEDEELTTSLIDCIKDYATEEKLSGKDCWECPKCNAKREVTKKLDLYELPTVLVIHFKRFQYILNFGDKLNTFVDFPLENLDLSEFLPEHTTKNKKFNLIGVSNHLGGLSSGHYTAYARKTKGDNNWYNLNDSTCSLIEDPQKKIVSSDAYMLFYETVDEQNYNWPSDEVLDNCFEIPKEDEETKKEENSKDNTDKASDSGRGDSDRPHKKTRQDNDGQRGGASAGGHNNRRQDEELMTCPICERLISESQLESHWQKEHGEGGNGEGGNNGDMSFENPEAFPNENNSLALIEDVVELSKEIKSSIESYGQLFGFGSGEISEFEKLVKKLVSKGANIDFCPFDKEKSSKKEVLVQANYAFDLFENDILFPIGTVGYLRASVLHHVFSKVFNLKNVVLPHGVTEGFDPREHTDANEDNFWEYLISVPDNNEKDNENSHLYCFNKAFGYERPERFGEKESLGKTLVPTEDGNSNWGNMNRDRREMKKIFEKEYFDVSKRDENSRKVFVIFHEYVNVLITRLLESNSGRLDSVTILVLPHHNKLSGAGSNINQFKSQQGKENYTKSQLIVDTYNELAVEFKSLFNLIN